MTSIPLLTFWRRTLDPGTRLAEILFGLIMTLTFTLGAGLLVQQEGREGARTLFIAMLGCNTAWGIVDGMLYLILELFDRAQQARLDRAVRLAPTIHEAATAIATELDDKLARLMTSPQRMKAYRWMAANVRDRVEEPVRITRDDVLGSLASFSIVFLIGLPATIPFMLLDDPWLALRFSNGVLLALLFITGYAFGKSTLKHPVLIGFALTVLGIVLVVAAIALGG
jgi:hypothetical protein